MAEEVLFGDTRITIPAAGNTHTCSCISMTCLPACGQGPGLGPGQPAVAVKAAEGAVAVQAVAAVAAVGGAVVAVAAVAVSVVVAVAAMVVVVAVEHIGARAKAQARTGRAAASRQGTGRAMELANIIMHLRIARDFMERHGRTCTSVMAAPSLTRGRIGKTV